MAPYLFDQTQIDMDLSRLVAHVNARYWSNDWQLGFHANDGTVFGDCQVNLEILNQFPWADINLEPI